MSDEDFAGYDATPEEELDDLESVSPTDSEETDLEDADTAAVPASPESGA
jgi:hypothetical protein